jgi:hypothetical protein
MDVTRAKESARDKLARLLEEFQQAQARGDLRGQLEAMGRSYVERFL